MFLPQLVTLYFSSTYARFWQNLLRLHSFVNDLSEVGLQRMKDVGGKSRCDKWLFVIDCAVSWIRYCMEEDVTSGDTSDLYSKGARFESWPEHRICVCSLRSFHVHAGIAAQTGYHRVLPNDFQFIIHQWLWQVLTAAQKKPQLHSCVTAPKLQWKESNINRFLCVSNIVLFIFIACVSIHSLL